MFSENLKRRGSLESLQTLVKVPKIKDDDQVINVKEKLDDNIENEINLTKAQVNALKTLRDTSKAPIDNVRSANKECKANTKACTANMFTKKDFFSPTQLTFPQPGGQIMPPKYWCSNSKTSRYTLNESKSLPTLFQRTMALRS